MERQKDIIFMGASDIPINKVYEQHTRSSTKQGEREKYIKRRKKTPHKYCTQRETERQRDRETDIQRYRKTERDRETERQRDRETERQR